MDPKSVCWIILEGGVVGPVKSGTWMQRTTVPEGLDRGCWLVNVEGGRESDIARLRKMTEAMSWP